MSNAQPEPSMEEILASIRRIISEDEEEQAPKPAPRAETPRPRPVEPPPPPRPVEAARPVVAPQPVRASAARIESEPKFATEDIEMIRKNAAEAIAEDDLIVGESTAAAASKAFMSLSQTVEVSDHRSRTLEDIVVEMLRPMVKDWLDANLAQIVEEKVEEEVQRVARRRR